jgi:hypothetical protein
LTVGLVEGACSDVEQVFFEVAKFDKREKLEELMQDPANLVYIILGYLFRTLPTTSSSTTSKVQTASSLKILEI